MRSVPLQPASDNRIISSKRLYIRAWVIYYDYMATNPKYQPRGRTDEASYDYTDSPAALAASFGRERLEEALTELEDGDTHVMLKFDYEEWVPVEAVREALALAKRPQRDSWPPRRTSWI